MERFAHVGRDPVFKKRKAKKIKVDGRFALNIETDATETRRYDGHEADDSSSGEEDEFSEEELEIPAWDADLPATHEKLQAPETARLAVTDCDWEKTRARDLYALLRSLCPSGGRVVRVKVYSSKFGERETAREEQKGPRLGEGPDAVRRYEMSKLRRFFAIADFDAAATALHVYSHDGVDFEDAPLNLSFVPDGQRFDQPLRDAASDAEGYEPPDRGKSRHHTRVECSWEAEDPLRKVAFERGDVDDYVASGDDRGDKKALRRSLGLDSPVESSGGDGDDEATCVRQAAAPPKKKKRKRAVVLAKKSGEPDDNNNDDQFRFDAADPRFAGPLNADGRFGIDPTAPAFKHTDAMAHLMATQAKHRRHKKAA